MEEYSVIVRASMLVPVKISQQKKEQARDTSAHL